MAASTKGKQTAPDTPRYPALAELMAQLFEAQVRNGVTLGFASAQVGPIKVGLSLALGADAILELQQITEELMESGPSDDDDDDFPDDEPEEWPVSLDEPTFTD